MLDTFPPNNTPAPLYKAKTAYSDKWIKSHSYMHLNDGFVLLAAPVHEDVIKVKGFEEDVFDIFTPNKTPFLTFANEYTICMYINRDDAEGKEIFTNDIVFLKRKGTGEEHHGVIVFDKEASAYCIRVDTEKEPRLVHFEDGDEILVCGNIYDG